MSDLQSTQSADSDGGMPTSPAVPSQAVSEAVRTDRRARGVGAIFFALLMAVSWTVAAGRGAVVLLSVVLVAIPVAVTWLSGIHRLLFGESRDTAQLATSMVVSVFSLSLVAFALGGIATTALQPTPSDVVDISVCKDAAASEPVVYGLDPTAPTLVLVRGHGSDGARAASIVERHVRDALRDNRGLLQEVPTGDNEEDVVARVVSNALRGAATEVFASLFEDATVEATVLALHGDRLIGANVGGMRVGIVRGGQWTDLTAPSDQRISIVDDVEVDLAALGLVDDDVVVVIADGSTVPITPVGFDVVALAANHVGAAVLHFHPLSTEREAALPLTCSSSRMPW
jgi:hypothetical protein